MCKQFLRTVHFSLIIVLLMSLVTPMNALGQTAEGGPWIEITNMYVNPESHTDESRPAKDGDVPRTTKNPTTVTASVKNISRDQLPNIYYEVTNVTTGITIEEKGNQATLHDSTLTFQNVTLTEGLNRITIIMDNQGVYTFRPGWIYYTSSMNISDLRIDQKPFVDHKIYPENPGLGSILNITGKAPNATEVTAEIGGIEHTGYLNDGEFFFLADDINNENSFATIKLRPGDNQITFKAKDYANDRNFYQLTRSFIYDNGSSFAYDAKLRADTSDTAHPFYGWRSLISDVLYDLNDDLVFQAKIKVNLVPETVEALRYVPEHQYINVLFGGTSYTYDLSNCTPTDCGAYEELTFDSQDTDGAKYFIYSFEKKITTAELNQHDSTQFLQFTFYTNEHAPNNPKTSYSFTYQNPNLPYVAFASRATADGMRPIRLTDVGVNEINEQPAPMQVYTNPNTEAVHIYLEDEMSSELYKELNEYKVTELDGVTYHVFSFLLEGVMNAEKTLSFIPLWEDAHGDLNESSAGAKKYIIAVSSAPYVIFNNVYNGLVIRDESELRCTVYAQNCLSGRLVNVPSEDYSQVQVEVNGVVMNMRADFTADGGDFIAPSDVDSPTLQDSNGAFHFGYNIPGDSARQAKLIEGKNIVTVTIWMNGRVVTKQSAEFFLFTKNTPQMSDVVPVDAEKFIQTTTGNYATNERNISLQGSFRDADTIKFTVRTVNEDGDPVVKCMIWDLRTNQRGSGCADNSTDSIIGEPTFANITSTQFRTGSVKLNPQGDTFFEFEIANASGIKVIKMVGVYREPVLYRFEAPNFIQDAKGDWIANINSNFVKFKVEAEGADHIVYDKQEYVVNKDDGLFHFEATDLKRGRNTIKFDVIRGSQKSSVSVIVNNVSTSVQGATFKSVIKNRMDAFDGLVKLSLPRGTAFMRNEESVTNPYITTDRQILFGLANPTDGRISKDETADPTGRSLLRTPARFVSASPMVWIDAGTIRSNEDLKEGLLGSGRLPWEGISFYQRYLNDLAVPTQRGTLTLKYNESIRESAWKYITVFHFDTYEDYRGVTGPRWRNIGGVVNTSKNEIEVSFDRPGYYQVMYMAQSYDDAIELDWARDDVDTMHSKGIMAGLDHYLFGVNEAVTRGEFATMLVKIFNIPLQYTDVPTFSDVMRTNPLSNGLYDYKYIETAAKVGIVRGTSLGMFLPDQPLTREQAALMLARAGEYKLNADPQKSLTALHKKFTDANSIDPASLTAVEAIEKQKLILGKPNVLQEGQSKLTYRFDPQGIFTRAEAATIAVRLMKQQKLLPK